MIHDKLKNALSEFPVGYSSEKIEDFRYIVF